MLMDALKRRPTFTLRYLMLLIFWWALALAMIREILPIGYSSLPSDAGGLCYLLLPMALGPAYGGLVLRMRFGFYAGLSMTAMMLAWLGLVALILTLADY